MLTPDRKPILIKRPEVEKRTGLSVADIYRRLREETDFPQPVKLPIQSVAWVYTEIDDWIAKQIEKPRRKHGRLHND